MPMGVWRRVGNAAVPADERSLAFLHARKDGSEFMANTHGARNPKQHALWWCLCALVAENDEHYPTPDKASDGLKFALGHVDHFTDRQGRLHVSPKSISFESITQEEFDQLFQGAVKIIAEWTGSKPAEVQSRFNDMVADKRWDGHRR